MVTRISPRRFTEVIYFTWVSFVFKDSVLQFRLWINPEKVPCDHVKIGK